MTPYVLSAVVGLAVGIIYGVLNVRSPAHLKSRWSGCSASWQPRMRPSNAARLVVYRRSMSSARSTMENLDMTRHL